MFTPRCPECDREVGIGATACPYCGRPARPKDWRASRALKAFGTLTSAAGLLSLWADGHAAVATMGLGVLMLVVGRLLESS